MLTYHRVVKNCFLFLASISILLQASSSSTSIRLSCTTKSIVRYRVTFLAEWTEERFYKMYPRVRPPAQWAKVLGRIHDEDYTLWREGGMASEGLKDYVEKRDSTKLDLETQGSPSSILDVFTMPPLPAGYGNESTVIFADHKRHLVSMTIKLHPSPDWFVGVDSLDLCERDGSSKKWREQKIVELYPYDAGTDDGFTFTAPNWATVPQAPITRITHLKPDHEASSFYYPDKHELPRLGALVFTREDLFFKAIRGTESETYVEDIVEEIGFTTPRPTDSDAKSNKVPSSSSTPAGDASSVGEPSSGSSTKFDPKIFSLPKSGVHAPDAWWLKTHKLPPQKHPEDQPAKKKPVFSSFDLLSPSARKRLRSRPSSSSYSPIRQSNRRRGFKFTLGKSGGANNKQPSKIDWKQAAKARKDCLVTNWSAWSSCSKTCGFGQRTRSRKVTQPATSGGVACPKLVQTETCGSMRGCGWKHFSSDNWENMTYEPTMRRLRRRRTSRSRS